MALRELDDPRWSADAGSELDSGLPHRDRRFWWYRLGCSSAILVAGFAAMVAILFLQGRLVVDESGRLRWQRPPLYLYEPNHGVTGHRYVYDDRLGWRNIPNWTASTQGRRLTINSRGLRDREHSPQKPANVMRILVLGDSFAWGYGVADDEVFAHVLEQDLGERAAGMPHADKSASWEVINTGVSGWGTDQQLLYLEQEGFSYQPDVVVLAFFVFNDPANNASPFQYGLHKPVLREGDLAPRNVPVPPPGNRPDSSLKVADRRQHTAAIIRRIAERCDARGAPFVVMKFGMFLPQAADLREDDQWYCQSIEAMPNTLLLDLDKAFEAEEISTRRLLEGNDDGHWNAFGHRVTARILREFLISNGLVSPDARPHHAMNGDQVRANHNVPLAESRPWRS